VLVLAWHVSFNVSFTCTVLSFSWIIKLIDYLIDTWDTKQLHVQHVIRGFLKWYALYKFTFYLLTYLLTTLCCHRVMWRGNVSVRWRLSVWRWSVHRLRLQLYLRCCQVMLFITQHQIHQMQLIATRFFEAWVWCGCLSLCHAPEPCKSGWTDRRPVWLGVAVNSPPSPS